MGKRKRSTRETEILEEEPPEKRDTSHLPPLTRLSDEVPEKEGTWSNKQRVLVFSSRGLIARERHFMEDMRQMLPHSKSEPKRDAKCDLKAINEIAATRNCNKVIYFETRKCKDLYMWVTDVKTGPSVKFHVINMHTMGELNMSGNCLKGSRPLLKFDDQFNSPHMSLIRELFVQTFGTPNQHPKSQPFFDHIFTFTILGGKIWFRNYQILEEDGELAEIGPRFVLNPIKILEGSFRGRTLWDNPKFKTPNSVRSYMKMMTADKIMHKDKMQYITEKRLDREPFKHDKHLDDVFKN